MSTGSTAAEVKFILDEHAAEAIRDWSLKEMAGDPHAVDSRGGYRTASLYFDTDDFDLYHRRGSTGRAKYRIRRYNNSDVVFLERKMRKGGKTTKRRSEVDITDLQRLAEHHEDWEGRWFARRLRNRNLIPVCQISYRRTARVAAPDGRGLSPLRLTLDRSLCATAIDHIAFTDRAGDDILPGKSILELKYPAAAPEFFDALIERFALERQSMSKYRLAVSALGLVESVD